MKKILISLLILVSGIFVINAEETSSFTMPSLVFTEGATFNQITRIEVLENRSNFVRENFLVGAYFNVSTADLWLLDFEFFI